MQNRKSIEQCLNEYYPPIKEILVMKNSSIAAIKKGVGTIDEMLQYCCNYSRNKNDNVSSHQIRNIFSLIQSVGDNDLQGLHLIRPKLAYIGSRQRNDSGKIIVRVLDSLIKSIEESKSAEEIELQIKGLKRVMESIVAYHKFHSNN